MGKSDASSNAGVNVECRAPAAVAEAMATKVGVSKCSASTFNLIMLGILAGVYIGFGAVFATLVAGDAAKFVGFGLGKLITGAVFSVGLILVVIAGAELFTGNNLIFASVLGGHASTGKLLRNWIIVYIANFVGSILLVLIMYGSELWKSNGMGVGVTALNIANAKCNLSFWPAFLRAIGCNWLVCLAVWMSIASKDVAGKILAIFFPIMAFVAIGFEHCIANMFFIPMGLMLKGTEVLETAMTANPALDISNLTWGGGFIVRNLIPVTIGNIVGGAIFVGLVYWSVYQRNAKKA